MSTYKSTCAAIAADDTIQQQQSKVARAVNTHICTRWHPDETLAIVEASYGEIYGLVLSP